MGHKYIDAFNKDLDRLLKELERLNKVLSKNPEDAKAKAAKAKLAPFLTRQALEKRRDLALKLDQQETEKIIKDSGLPW
ncbi:hypothetical protein KAK06_01660 [Ideonella sp. 4Y11]|uniref:Uncharacterized protein n=1 Tax=Ideonella aquatica TaxID=2824119 RepID=A0A940YKE8_9BURK|nr:hypothetical protein [Ideonella aquatica]MBQ0957653.1 hypothetical protein [Ideonella aquatica]